MPRDNYTGGNVPVSDQSSTYSHLIEVFFEATKSMTIGRPPLGGRLRRRTQELEPCDRTAPPIYSAAALKQRKKQYIPLHNF